MNRTSLLATCAVVAFVTATGASLAQQERMPQQERGAPAEKMAPQNSPAGRNQGPDGRAGESQQNRGRGETTGQAPREDRPNGAPEQNRTTGQAPREDRTNRSSEQNRLEQQRGRTNRTDENRATGQGTAGTTANIDLTPEKRTRIHEVIINERSAPRVSSPNFNVSIGTRVPRTVRFAALPRTIVEIEPAWRGYQYFMIGDQIVIVDPRSMEIVAILDA